MSYIMKYRKKDSNDDWKFYEENNKKRCVDYLRMREFEDDYEYEIYDLSEEGVVWGVYMEEINPEEFEDEDEDMEMSPEFIDFHKSVDLINEINKSKK